DVDRRRPGPGHPFEIVEHAPLDVASELREPGSPVDVEVELDVDGAVLAADSNAAVPVQLARDEAAHAFDLASGVGGVARENLAGNAGLTLHSRRFYEHELRCLRPRQEPERHEGGAEAGGNMERWAVPPVETVDVAPAWMRERDPADRKRQRDLAGMQMAGEDEIESTFRQPVDHVREVAEQDSQVRLRVGQARRLRNTAPICARVDADNLN